REIIFNMSWWIGCWVKKFNSKVHRSYIIHDTEAEEVSEEQFYTKQSWGGTLCSTAFKKISDLIDVKFDPIKYNIYVFYFTDGDDWSDDKPRLHRILKENLNKNIVNMIGITQVLPYGGELLADLN